MHRPWAYTTYSTLNIFSYVYHCMVIIAGVEISKSDSSAMHTGEENETEYEVV